MGIVPKLPTVTAETDPTAIQESLRLHKEVEVSYAQCRRVKPALLHTSINDSLDDYNKLPVYFERLKDTNKSEDNPEGPVTDPVIENGVFKRIFIGPHTSD